MIAGFAPLGPTAVAKAATAQQEGLVCAPGSTAPGGSTAVAPTVGTQPSFVLTAQDGYITTPDGNSVYMWGYSAGNNGFQYPGPVLCVYQGDKVTVTLRNTLPVDTSLQFPGITTLSVDGSALVPDLVDNSLSKIAPRNPLSQPNHGLLGGSVTYSFTAGRPGTFLYESGTDPQTQVQMGLAGALIVRPCNQATTPCTPEPAHVYDDMSNKATTQHWSSTTVYQQGDRVRLVNAQGLSQVWQAQTNIAAGGAAPGTPGSLAMWDLGTDLADFSRFNPQHEYLHVLSEIDPAQHQAYETSNSEPWNSSKASGYALGADVTANGLMYQSTAAANTSNPSTAGSSWAPMFDATKYNARYWFINGRSFPDTIAPNFSAHLPTQPYGALVHIQPITPPSSSAYYSSLDVGNEWPALVRFLNTGPVDYPFHPHADHDRQVGIDASPQINNLDQTDVSTDHFGLVVAPGQTTEGLFSWYDAQHWSSGQNPIVVPIPDLQSRAAGAYWSQTPYLGDRQDPNTGVVQYNQCGELYHVAHSHALFQATNFGAPGGGMLTMIRVDPPNSFPNHANCSEPWNG